MFIVAAAVALAALPLAAGNVTFNGVPASDNPIYIDPLTTGGFVFSPTGGGSFHVIGTPSLCAGGCVDNGSTYLAVAGPALDSPVLMTSVSGKPFSITSLDAAKLFLTPGGLGGLPNADTLDLLGTFAGGGTITVSLTLPAEGSFSAFPLSGFTNLSSLQISGSVIGGSTDASWAVDNLVATVPEPSFVWLLGMEIGGLIALRRFPRG